MRLPRARPSTWGVRVRSTLVSIVITALAFGVTAGALLWILQRSLEDSSDSASRARSDEIAVQLRSSGPEALESTLLATTGPTEYVQVLDGGGAVVRSSADAPTTPLTGPATPDAPPRYAEVQDADGDHLRLVVRSVSTPSGPSTIVVAADQDALDETVNTVLGLLAVGLPVLVLVVGASTYALVGRSLHTVEQMRSTVDTISTADLSERLRVPDTHDEVSRLATTLNAMLGRIEDGHAAQRRFVGDASHELRSPLSTLSAALELGSERTGFLEPELVRDRLLPETQRMQHLVDDLLLLARADERALPLRITDVDLDDVLDNELIRLRATSPSLRVVREIVPLQVRGDGQQLTRVVRNLVDNAARHASSTVVLGCGTDAGRSWVRIADDGPGIPSHERDRVLERFVRLDPDRARAAGGSGLGLSIVREIVLAHAGHVAIGEPRGGGTEVTVVLPSAGPAQVPGAARWVLPDPCERRLP